MGLKFFYYLLILAIIEPAVSYADEMPNDYRSGYYLGRGNTGVAIAEDEEAIFYNPAGIALGKGVFKKIVLLSPLIEVSKDTRDVVREISLQDNDPTETLRKHRGAPQHLGVSNFTGVILRKAAIGVYTQSSSTVLLFMDPKARGFETIDASSRSDVGLTFSLAYRLSNGPFYVGSTFKYIKRLQAHFSANATDTSQASNVSSNSKYAMSGVGTGADLGLMYQNDSRIQVAFGLTVKDVGGTVFIPDEKTTLSKDERPLKSNVQQVNIGAAIIPGTRMSRFKLLADYTDALNATKTDLSKHVHLGAELTVMNIIGMTGGINQGYPCFGLYFDANFIRVDLGVYGEEIGDYAGSRPDVRAFFKLSMGI